MKSGSLAVYVKITASHRLDDLRLFHLFRTGSAPGGSLRFPMRWSTSERVFFIGLSMITPAG